MIMITPLEIYIYIAISTIILGIWVLYLDRRDLTIGGLLLTVLIASIPLINVIYMFFLTGFLLEHLGSVKIFKWSNRK